MQHATTLYGLIGYPLSHSFSPTYFANKFAAEAIDAEYRVFPLRNLNELPGLLEMHPSIRGLNITIPYKQEVHTYLHSIDDAAKNIGAVNCITINEGQLCGYNTDVIGFHNSLQPLLQPQHTQALILGTGGAARAAMYVLRQLGISYQVVSRQKSPKALTYDDITADIINTHKLIINSSPAGMHPLVDAFPHLPYQALGPDHLLYDMVYNPPETLFLRFGKQYGCMVKNGLEMLHLQAEASWHIWNGM